MNAADRRRLTPVLGVLAIVLALLLIALLGGLGRHARWHGKAAPRRLPPVGPARPVPTVPALEQFARVWQHPLFSPSRTPEPVKTQSGSSGDLLLTGVILLPSLRMAILHDKSNDKNYRVVEGRPSNAGLTLLVLHPRSAVVEASGSRLNLQLIPGSSPGAGSTRPSGGGAIARGTQPNTEGASASGASAMVDRRGARTPNSRRTTGVDPASVAARARALKARIEAHRRQARQRDSGG